jgi:hypothetical protein
MHMPVVAQELFFEYHRKVESIRKYMHSVNDRQKQGEKASETVLKHFTNAIEETSVPAQVELLLPGRMKSITNFISKDPREVTEPALLDGFWSTKLFRGRQQVGALSSCTMLTWPIL